MERRRASARGGSHHLAQHAAASAGSDGAANRPGARRRFRARHRPRRRPDDLRAPRHPPALHHRRQRGIDCRRRLRQRRRSRRDRPRRLLDAVQRRRAMEPLPDGVHGQRADEARSSRDCSRPTASKTCGSRSAWWRPTSAPASRCRSATPATWCCRFARAAPTRGSSSRSRCGRSPAGGRRDEHGDPGASLARELGATHVISVALPAPPCRRPPKDVFQVIRRCFQIMQGRSEDGWRARERSRHRAGSQVDRMERVRERTGAGEGGRSGGAGGAAGDRVVGDEDCVVSCPGDRAGQLRVAPGFW